MTDASCATIPAALQGYAASAAAGANITLDPEVSHRVKQMSSLEQLSADLEVQVNAAIDAAKALQAAAGHSDLGRVASTSLTDLQKVRGWLLYHNYKK